MAAQDPSKDNHQLLSRDDQFLANLRKIVEENLDNEQFGVEQLAEDISLSRTHLYRKLQHLTGKNISQYIREVRLEKAMELLKNDVATISEIAYRVGFNSPAYFNKCFNDKYGFPPGDVIKKTKRGIGSERDPDKTVGHGMASVRHRITTITKSRLKSISILIAATLILLISGFLFIKNEKYPLDIFDRDKEASIAVLPFRNFSPDQKNQYFCSGIMDEILSHLQRIEDLQVKARTSSEVYGSQPKNIRLIGKELDVSYILEGSVRKSGKKLRITVQLIDARTGNHVWSESYDGEYNEEIFTFQSNIARKVAKSMNAVITPDERKRLEAMPSPDMRAYELWLKGNEHIRNCIRDHDCSYLDFALNAFNQALEIDPDYVKALEGKARVFRHMGKFDSTLYYCNKIINEFPEQASGGYGIKGFLYLKFFNRPDSAYPYIKKAVELKPGDHFMVMLLAQYYDMGEKNIVKGMPYYSRAYRIGGESSPELNTELWRVCMEVGQFKKSLKYIDQAIQLTGECHLFYPLGISFIFLEQYESGIQYLDSVCSISSCKEKCDQEKFKFYVHQKKFDSAGLYYKRLNHGDYEPNRHYQLFLAYYHKQTGNQEKGDSILTSNIKRMEETYQRKIKNVRIGLPAIDLDLVQAYAIKNDKKNSMRILLRLEKGGYTFNLGHYMEYSPFFESLRNDPDIRDIIERYKEKDAETSKRVQEMLDQNEISL